MGDASLKSLALQPIQDTQEADTSKGNFACDNASEDCASSIKITDAAEQSSAINSQRMEEDDPYSGKDHIQTEAEAAQSDVSGLIDKVSSRGNNHKNREENLDGDRSPNCSLLSTDVQECKQRIVDKVDAEEHAFALHSSKAEQLSSICESPLREECATLDHDFSDDSRAVSHEHTVVVENATGGESYVPSKMSKDSEKTEADLEKRHGSGEESGSLDGTNTSSTLPSITASIPKGNFSKDTSQPPPLLSGNESRQQESQPAKELVGDSETLSSLTSTEKGQVNNGFQNELDLFLDTSNQEWSDLDFGVATLISTHIEGWQRFETEEVITGTDYTQGTDQRGGMWEQLLDDGLDSIERDDVIQPLQITLPPPYKENHFELASPGNPFVEGMERANNFSEAVVFLRSKDLPSIDRLSQVSEEHSSLPPLKKGFFDEKGHGDPSSDGATITEGEKNVVKPNSVNEQATKLRLQSSSSLDFMEPFEAPSFMSLVDPKSHALFEASMPAYQAKCSGYGHENGEEQWVANFDLMAPSTQEITRSISMPRPGSDMPGQRPGQSVSFTVNREQETGKKESNSPSAHRSMSGFLSPKFSPLVQKVVDKVRNTPAVANGVLNSVRQVMSPKASAKKSTSGSLLTRCICW